MRSLRYDVDCGIPIGPIRKNLKTRGVDAMVSTYFRPDAASDERARATFDSRRIIATTSRLCIIGAFLAIAASVPARADLVVNGGFESGDFTGWVVSDSNGIVIDNADFDSGSASASLGSFGTPGTLSQTLTTMAGTSYQISYFLHNQGTGTGFPPAVELFQASFDGVVLDTETGVLVSGGYNFFNFQQIASSASTALVFTEQNDDSVWNLDDVSVTPVTASVPEPGSATLLASAVLLALGYARRGSLARPSATDAQLVFSPACETKARFRIMDRLDAGHAGARCASILRQNPLWARCVIAGCHPTSGQEVR